MTTIPILDANGNIVYFDGDGAGTLADPFSVRQKISIDYESGALDLRGRMPVANPQMQFAYAAQLTDNETMVERIVGGASSALQYDESCVDISCGTASGDKLTRQSHTYVPYLPGTPVEGTLTGAFASSKTNVAQRLGLFDDLNGVFFEDDGTGMGIVRRTNVTGSVVNNRVAQASWNVDPLDGTGPSGVTISDFGGRFLLFGVRFLWQGAVGAEFFVEIGFDSFVVHQIKATDLAIGVPFMGKASLPARYEIENTGVAGSATTMKTGCVDVIASGARRLVGFDWSVSNYDTLIPITTSEEVILVARLKTTLGGNQVRRTLKLLEVSGFSTADTAYFRVAIIHQPTSVGAAGWVDVDSNHSAIEYNISQPAITGGAVHNVIHFDAPANSSGAVNRPGTGGSSPRFDDTHSLCALNIDGNNSDLIVVYATGAAATNVKANMKLLEFD